MCGKAIEVGVDLIGRELSRAVLGRIEYPVREVRRDGEGNARQRAVLAQNVFQADKRRRGEEPIRDLLQNQQGEPRRAVNRKHCALGDESGCIRERQRVRHEPARRFRAGGHVLARGPSKREIRNAGLRIQSGHLVVGERPHGFEPLTNPLLTRGVARRRVDAREVGHHGGVLRTEGPDGLSAGLLARLRPLGEDGSGHDQRNQNERETERPGYGTHASEHVDPPCR